MEEQIMNKLIKMLQKANKNDEVPVSAIITKGDKIIAATYNKREKNSDVLGHSEIICIKKASKKLHTWKLDECNMYVTLKPCSMCEKIIKESRIKNVFYIIDRSVEKKEYDKTNIVKVNDKNLEEKVKQIMNNFFKNKR